MSIQPKIAPTSGLWYNIEYYAPALRRWAIFSQQSSQIAARAVFLERCRQRPNHNHRVVRCEVIQSTILAHTAGNPPQKTVAN
jgi:hypothetical protein